MKTSTDYGTNFIFRSILYSFLILFISVNIRVNVNAKEVYPLQGRVNDYANVISPATKSILEEKLKDLERTDSTQIVVLTFKSLEGDNLENYSIKTAEAWKIGSKKNDNGVILMVVTDDHLVRIEVGRGLEGKLTDLISGRIIRNNIIPYFKEGDYDQGILSGVNSIIQVVKGEYSATPGTGEEKGVQASTGAHKSRGQVGILFLLIGLIIIMRLLSRSRTIVSGMSNSGTTAGRGGDGLGRRLLRALIMAIFLPFILMALIGISNIFFLIIFAIIGLIIGHNFRGGGRGGGSGIMLGGGGLGGGWGGDGGLGGGGGSFGGGGASGKW